MARHQADAAVYPLRQRTDKRLQDIIYSPLAGHYPGKLLTSFAYALIPRVGLCMF